MIIKNITIEEARLHKAKDSAAHVVLNGLAATIYTGEDVEKPLRWLTSTEFRDRFTTEEMKAILTLATTDLNVKLLLFKLQTVSDIGLDTADVVNGVKYLATTKAIPLERVADILM